MLTLLPSMKTARIDGVTAVADDIAITIEAYEGPRNGQLTSLLAALAFPDTVMSLGRFGPKTEYAARVRFSAIATLAASEQVYSVSMSPDEGIPASERQGVIVIQPKPAGALTIPAANPSYTGYLNGKCYAGRCISDFSNTKIALVDTGFDNGDVTSAGINLDFKWPNGTPEISVSQGSTQFNQTTETSNLDNVSHGTLTTSVITGNVASGTRVDSQGYRYTLGLAPGVLAAVDKFFAGTAGDYTPALTGLQARLSAALSVLNNYGPNIVNHSWNGGGPQPTPTCNYEDTSMLLDQDTRSQNRLNVVAAGNNTPGYPCPYIEPPATAKNVIAVGATESFTLSNTAWPNSAGNAVTCPWNTAPTSQDARNIPSFSAVGRGAGSYIKPDVVAPGLRVTGPSSRGGYTSPGIFCNTDLDGTSYNNGGVQYGFSAGTSFAAPVVSGVAAVVRKWYNLINSGANPSPAMTKAIVINGAIDIAGGSIRNSSGAVVGTVGHIPDVHQGWGEVNLSRLLGPATTYKFVDQTTIMLSNQGYEITGLVVDGSKDVRITLVWTDPPQSTLAMPTAPVINNLDLGAFFFGDCPYVGNSFSNGVSVHCGSTVDAVNNVEEVIIPGGTAVTGALLYVTVNSRTLMGDGITPGSGQLRQDFALFTNNLH